MQYSIHPFYTWSERIYNIQKIHYPYRMQYRWIKWFYWNSILMISYSKNLVLQDSVLIKGCIYPWIHKKKGSPSFHSIAISIPIKGNPNLCHWIPVQKNDLWTTRYFNTVISFISIERYIYPWVKKTSPSPSFYHHIDYHSYYY